MIPAICGSDGLGEQSGATYTRQCKRRWGPGQRTRRAPSLPFQHALKGGARALPSIGTLLVDANAITQKHLDEALQCQVLFGGSIGTNLLELGYVSEATLSKLLAEQLKVGVPDLDALEAIPSDVIKVIPAPLAEELCAVPIAREGGKLRVAMPDPRDSRALQTLSQTTSSEVEPVIVVEARLAYLLEKYYGVRREQRYVNLIRNLVTAKTQVQQPEDVKAAEAAADVWVSNEDAGATGHFDRIQSEAAEKPHIKVHKLTREELKEMLVTAKSRDDVAQVVLSYAQNFFRRSCLLVVKRDIAYGWAGYGPHVSPAAVRGVMIPLSQHSVFRTVHETRAPYVGPMADTAVNHRFLSALGDESPQTVMAIPIAYGETLIAILYGDNGAGKGVPPRHVSELQFLSAEVARAFQGLIERLRGR